MVRDAEPCVARAAELAWLGPRTGPGERCRKPWTAALLMQLIDLEFSSDGKSLAPAERHAWQLVRTFPDSPAAREKAL